MPSRSSASETLPDWWRHPCRAARCPVRGGSRRNPVPRCSRPSRLGDSCGCPSFPVAPSCPPRHLGYLRSEHSVETAARDRNECQGGHPWSSTVRWRNEAPSSRNKVAMPTNSQRAKGGSFDSPQPPGGRHRWHRAPDARVPIECAGRRLGVHRSWKITDQGITQG